MPKRKPSTDSVAIRRARRGDAARLAALCDQLGYPTSRGEAARRLAAIARDARHVVYVAESGSAVVGWLHAFVPTLLLAAHLGEIAGPVVEESRRGRGVGRLLLARAEQWSQKQGCRAVQLRSNVIRRRAHAFYRRLGYRKIKTSLVFRKSWR